MKRRRRTEVSRWRNRARLDHMKGLTLVEVDVSPEVLVFLEIVNKGLELLSVIQSRKSGQKGT